MESRHVYIGLLAVFIASVVSLPVPEGAGTKTGALAGAVAGGVAAGPVGAVVGGGVGALAGHEVHKANKNADQAKAASGAVAFAEEDFARVKREGAGTKTGALAGAVAGGVAAGPVGAAVGAGVGALAGHELHSANKHANEAKAASGAAPSAFTEEDISRVKREGPGTKTGALAGAVAGGVAAGPIGAAVGAGVGALAGHELHKANKHSNEAKIASGVPVAAFIEDHDRVKREVEGAATGALGGALAGGVVAGPVGAAVGAAAGGLAGNEIQKANTHANEAKAASGLPVAPFVEDHDRLKREVEGAATGALGGAIAGGVVAGPVGAAVGAGVGGLAGHSIQKANTNAKEAKAAAGAPPAALVEEYRVKREGPGTKTGALAGAVAGGVAAGPIGAAVGAGVGALAGHELHKANKHANEAKVQSAVNSGQPIVVQQ